MPEIFNKKFFLQTGYKITEEPVGRLSRKVEKHVEWSFHLPKQRKISSRDISKLKGLIKEFPNERVFRNHLVAVYGIRGQMEMAKQEAITVVEDFPDYDFGKITLADIYLKEDNYEAASKLLGESRKIEDFVSDEIIHYTLFRSYQVTAAQIDIHEGKEEIAEDRIKLIDKLLPDNKVTKPIRIQILMSRMKKMRERMAKAEDLRRNVATFSKVKYEQTDKPIKLEHDVELNSFYETKWDEIPDNYEQILALPRETLIPDLENILIDSLQRYEYFEQEVDDWKENSFPNHAAQFLGFLESEQAIDTILNIFRQGEDFLLYWYGEMIENTFENVLFKITKSQENRQKLLDFMLEENIFRYTKVSVSEIIHWQILSEDMPREEGLNWYKTILEHFQNNLENENLIDTGVITYLCWDVCNARLNELLPFIQQFFEANLIDVMWAGDYSDYEKKANEPIKFWDIRVLPSTLEEFYELPQQHKNPEFSSLIPEEDDEMLEVISEMFHLPEEKDDFENDFEDDWEFNDSYEEEESTRLASPRNQTFIRSDKKIGRNDPCPCGSGKKYKKCHGKK